MLWLLLTYNFWTQCKELQKTKKVSGLQLRPSNRVTCHIHKKKGGTLTNDNEEKQGGSNLKSNFAWMEFKLASASITSVISMCVVPVKVSYAGTKKQILTYAMLDNCSQGCFMKDSIRKNLGADVERLRSQSKFWMVNKRWSQQWCQDWKFEVIVMKTLKDGLIYQQPIPRKSFQQM